jgi:hypothetical protein
MVRAASISYLASSILPAWRPPFRGQIYDYARRLNLQNGYAVKGNFDIATARHLIEPLEELRNPRTRLVSVQAAVQTMKSLLADLFVPYVIQHVPGDTLWLFEDEAKAKYYADTRAMPLITAIPEIARMLLSVDRHDQTKTQIRFPHMNLVIAGLNEGNVQSISWQNVIVDEAWMARANGLIRQAMDRTKQYPQSKKILILGQGGIEDEDFDRIHKETDQRVLHFHCPACGKSQPFELSRFRPEDFPTAALRGTYAGLSWETSTETRANGRWNYEKVGRTAHHRCFFCDFKIEDRPDVRRKLNDSYHYVATNPGAPADSVGFYWPGEASTRVSFADMAVKYLKAKVAKEETGLNLPMQEYLQKDRGLTWTVDSDSEFRPTVTETYDVNAEWPEEKYRFLIGDCQRDLKKFYISVFAVALSGESRELARETVESFDAIAEVQKKWNVKDQRVFLDCGYEMTKVLRECVRRGHVGWVNNGAKKIKMWMCWTGLKGSGQETFIHHHPKTKLPENRIYSERKFYDVNAGTSGNHPRAPYYEWSNLHCKDLARQRRDGEEGIPKLLTLPDTLPPTDQWSHFMQMRSEKRIVDFRKGKKAARWEPTKETRPNHEWDKVAMFMAVMAICGIVGDSHIEDQSIAV